MENVIKEIANNFYENFLKKFALNSVVVNKQLIINKVSDYSPFELIYIDSLKILQVKLAESLYLFYKINWTKRCTDKYIAYHLSKIEFLYSTKEKLK